MCVFKAKVVGLNFHKVENDVESGDYVILAAEDNEYDPDAIAVYNSDKELIGYIANSDKTLSPSNKKNGALSASELKGKLDFNDKEFYGEVDRAFKTCLFIQINDGQWSYTNKPKDDDSSIGFVKASELVDVDALRAEVESLKSIVADLHEVVLDLKLITISREK